MGRALVDVSVIIDAGLCTSESNTCRCPFLESDDGCYRWCCHPHRPDNAVFERNARPVWCPFGSGPIKIRMVTLTEGG
jgi:hypothetical protein